MRPLRAVGVCTFGLLGGPAPVAQSPNAFFNTHTLPSPQRFLTRLCHMMHCPWPRLRRLRPLCFLGCMYLVGASTDLSTIRSRAVAGFYKTLDMYAADVGRMFANCRVYNKPSTTFVACADRLQEWVNGRLKELAPAASGPAAAAAAAPGKP
jgi:hypothetical protein